MAKYKFNDIAINSTLKKKPVEDDKYHYIGLEHLNSGSLQVTRYGSEVAPKGEKLIMKKGDVLFGKRRAYQKKVGIAPFDGIFSAHGMVLRPKEDVVDKDFFPLFINSDYFLDAAIKISVGSLSPTINWGDLKELEFELPGLEEQRKLAKILWAAEETKQAYKNLLQKTDDLVKAKFEKMFGSEKNPQNDTPYLNLGNIASYINGCAFKPQDWQDHGLPIIRIQNLTGTSHDYNYFSGAYPKQAGVKNGDILISWSASLGIYVWRGPDAILNQHIFKVVFDKKIINEDFFVYAVSQKLKELISKTHGSTMKHIVKKEFDSIKIAYPLIDFQNEFANFAQQAEQSKQQLQKSLDSLNDIMRALINENLK